MEGVIRSSNGAVPEPQEQPWEALLAQDGTEVEVHG